MKLSFHFSEEELALPYCCSRTDYAREVGDVRQNNVAKVFKELLPFAEVKSGHINANGTDITISYNGETYKVEVINEDITSYIDAKRARSLFTNLSSSSASMFICNYGNFGTNEAENTLYGIPTLRLGWQELPSKHHNFYKKKNEIYQRRVSSKRSYRKLKEQILDFLISINFKLLMYIKYSRTTISNQISAFINRIQDLTSEVIESFSALKSKIRLKNNLFKLKSFVRARLAESYSNDKSKKVIMK